MYARRLVRETDVVEVIMVSTTDGVAEGRVVEQYRDFITKRGGGAECMAARLLACFKLANTVSLTRWPAC